MRCGAQYTPATRGEQETTFPLIPVWRTADMSNSLFALVTRLLVVAAAPTTGAIHVVVATTGSSADFDPNGYLLSVDTPYINIVDTNGLPYLSPESWTPVSGPAWGPR